MIITDAQVHVWQPESPERPWLPGAHSWAHGEEFSVEHVLAEMDATKVDRAVLVPPSFEGDRNDLCLAAAAMHPDRFRVMGRLPLDDKASRDLVPGWLDQPGMLGIRATFTKGAAVSWLTDGTADWLWPAAARAGLPLMLFLPGHLAELDVIAERHPDLRVVVDHLAINTDQRDDDLDPIIAELVGLARHENVAVKATCLSSNVTDPYPYRSLHDRIHRVVDAFSPRRVFWGSDLSRLRGSYDELRRMFTEELDFLSTDDLEWIMGRGVSEWLGWPAGGVDHGAG